MSNSPYTRAAIAQATLESMPSLIRNTLLEEREFWEDYKIDVEFTLTFGDLGVSFRRSVLFDAIRKILSGMTEQYVTDSDDREWNLRIEAEIGDLPTLMISANNRRIVLPEFAILSPVSAVRLRSLDEAASYANLPTMAQDFWRNVLSERTLENEEIEQFQSEFRDSPVHVAQSIRREIENGQSRISSLVPSSRRYFDRLVGGYDGSKSIRDYAAGTGRQFIKNLFEWRPYDGFMFSLLLSSHSTMTSEIIIDRLLSEDYAHIFDRIEKQSDSLSQLGAIEVGLHILPERPEIEPYIFRLIKKLRDDDVDTSTKGLKLLSALFILVDGELSRTRLMSAEPPFYRRLASFAHAALIQRQLITSDVDDNFFEWVNNNRGLQYFMQTLADMRLEPRWKPEFATATHIKDEFFGRIMIAANKCQKNIKNRELHSLIFGAGPESIQSPV